VKDEGGDRKLNLFEAATTFAGQKRGYVFKMGARGLGYYWDPKQNISVKEDLQEVKVIKEEGDKEEDKKK